MTLLKSSLAFHGQTSIGARLSLDNRPPIPQNFHSQLLCRARQPRCANQLLFGLAEAGHRLFSPPHSGLDRQRGGIGSYPASATMATAATPGHTEPPRLPFRAKSLHVHSRETVAAGKRHEIRRSCCRDGASIIKRSEGTSGGNLSGCELENFG